jgi:hypothetical protein
MFFKRIIFLAVCFGAVLAGDAYGSSASVCDSRGLLKQEFAQGQAIKHVLQEIDRNNSLGLAQKYGRGFLLNLPNLDLAPILEVTGALIRLLATRGPIIELDLSNCALVQIPSWVKNFEKLETLNLTGNQIPLSEIDKLQLCMPDLVIVTGSD